MMYEWVYPSVPRLSQYRANSEKLEMCLKSKDAYTLCDYNLKSKYLALKKDFILSLTGSIWMHLCIDGQIAEHTYVYTLRHVYTYRQSEYYMALLSLGPFGGKWIFCTSLHKGKHFSREELIKILKRKQKSISKQIFKVTIHCICQIFLSLSVIIKYWYIAIKYENLTGIKLKHVFLTHGMTQLIEASPTC